LIFTSIIILFFALIFQKPLIRTFTGILGTSFSIAIAFSGYILLGVKKIFQSSKEKKYVDLGAILMVMGSLDPMVYMGLAAISAAIAVYNVYQGIQKQKEEEDIQAKEQKKEESRRAQEEEEFTQEKARLAEEKKAAAQEEESSETEEAEIISHEDLLEIITNGILSLKEENLLMIKTFLASEQHRHPDQIFNLINQYHGQVIDLLNRNFSESPIDDVEFMFLAEHYFRQLLQLLQAKFAEFEEIDPEWEPILSRMYEFAPDAKEHFDTHADWDEDVAWKYNDFFFGYKVNPEPAPELAPEPAPEWYQVLISTGVSFPFPSFFYWCAVLISFCRIISTHPLSMREYFSWQWYYWWTFIKNLGQQNYLNLKLLKNNTLNFRKSKKL
jgi:hypothetical protein